MQFNGKQKLDADHHKVRYHRIRDRVYEDKEQRKIMLARLPA